MPYLPSAPHLPYTREEHAYLARRSVHNRYFHQGSPLLYASLTLIFVGLSGLAMYEHFYGLVLLFDLAEVTCIVVFLVMNIKACDCGQTPVIARSERQRLLRVSKLKAQIVHLAATVVGMCVYLVAVICIARFFSQEYLGLLVFGPALATGLGLLIPYMFPRTPRGMIPHHELARLNKLSNNDPDDLNELIEFQLKIGDFEGADACSKRLLELLEQ